MSDPWSEFTPVATQPRTASMSASPPTPQAADPWAEFTPAGSGAQAPAAGQIPGADPLYAAGQGPEQLAAKARQQYATQHPIAEKVQGLAEGALDVAAKLIGGVAGYPIGLVKAPFTGKSLPDEVANTSAEITQSARRMIGGLGLLGGIGGALASGPGGLQHAVSGALTNSGPTTQTGQGVSGAFDEAMQSLPPTIGVHGTLEPAVTAPGARGIGLRGTAGVVRDATEQMVADRSGGVIPRASEVASQTGPEATAAGGAGPAPGAESSVRGAPAAESTSTAPTPPKIDPETVRLAQKAQEYGIPLRPDMLSDNRLLKFIGDAMEKVPLGGSKAKDRQRAFNQALIQQIGGDDKAVALTPDVFDAAINRAGSEIGDVSDRTSVPVEDFGDLGGVARRETPDVQSVVNGYADDLKTIADQNDGIVPGEQLRKLRTQVAQQSRSSSNGDLRNALGQFVNRMDDALQRNADPQDVQALSDARRRYAVAKTIEPLVAKSPTGDISPSGLMSRVTSDRAGKARMARGQGGDLGDLARIGQKFLKEPPSSGTAERLGAYGTIGGLATGATVAPGAAAGGAATIAAANLYNRLGPHIAGRMVDKASAAAESSAQTASKVPREAPAALDPRLQEIERLKAAPGASPETLRVLDRQSKRITAENAAGKAVGETEADALEKAAGSTFEPSVRQALLARANQLRTEKIPVGDAKELSAIPTAPVERIGRIPVGEATELAPPTGHAPDIKPLPVGAATELNPQQAAAVAPTRRESELVRLRQDTSDPEIVKDLDKEIATERKRAADEQRGHEYLRLADSALDPQTRSKFEARARALGAQREAIPVPETHELPVESVEPAPTVAPAEASESLPNRIPDDEHADWLRKYKIGSLDEQTAHDVRQARQYDPQGVERAAQQYERSPVVFGREIGRIIERRNARASETERAAGSSEGLRNPAGGVPREAQGTAGDGGSAPDSAPGPGGGRPRAPGSTGDFGGSARPGGAEGVAVASTGNGTGDIAQRQPQRIDESSGLPLNDDGTVTLFHHTSAAKASEIRRTGRLKADAEPDVYVTTHRATDTGYGDTAVPIRVNPSRLQLDDEFQNGRKDFRISVGKPGGHVAVKVADESSAPPAQEPQAAAAPSGNKLAPESVLSPGLISEARDAIARHPIDESSPPALTEAERAQAKKDLAPRLQAASEAKPEFDEKLKAIAHGLGADVTLANVKGGARLLEKHVLENRSDVAEMRDLVRASIVVKKIADVPAALQSIRDNFEVTRLKDRFSTPLDTGYRDMLINVKMPGGVEGEIQLHIPEMIAAKKLGHKIFDIERRMGADHPEKPPLKDLQSRIYSEAYARSEGWPPTSNLLRPEISQAANSPSVRRSPSVPTLNSLGKEYDDPSRLNARQDPSGSLATGLPSTSKNSAPLGKSKSFIASTSASSLPDGPVGRTTIASTERGMTIPVRYRAVEAGDLITSHSDDLRPDPRFAQELQPRDRTRDASAAQIARIAGNIKPELMADSAKASDGAPIVGRDGMVESGNARSIALRRAYAAGKADHYRNWLASEAQRFGIDASKVMGMNQPVLVRESLGDYDRKEFAAQANESPVASMSEGERARSDSGRMPDMSGLEFDDTGGINFKRSADFVRDFLRTAASPTEMGELITSDGRLSQRGQSRIRNAVFARAYDAPDVVSMLTEAPDTNVKNVLTGLLHAAPAVARLRELSDAGARREAAFIPELIEAVRRYTALREQGATVAHGLAQGDLLGGDVPPAVAGLMRQLETNARAPRRIADMVSRLTGEIDAHGDPRQQGLGLE